MTLAPFNEPYRDCRVQRPKDFSKNEVEQRQDIGPERKLEPQQSLYTLLNGKKQRRGRQRQFSRFVDPSQCDNPDNAGRCRRDETC